MRCLFVNSTEPRCGVYQYGLSLFECLIAESSNHWTYLEATSQLHLNMAVGEHLPDVIAYNWQSGIGGFLNDAPFPNLPKQVLVYHDNDVSDRWDAFLFSDPTMAQNGKWFPIGRPLPLPLGRNPIRQKQLSIGVHGFIGAQANIVVGQAIKEFEYATVNLHLPLSPFCDDHGNIAGAMIEQCKDMAKGTGIHINASTEFMNRHDLLDWLSANSINCYFRDPAHQWRGVSSALDYALAARRPIAINKSSAFRHMHDARPSICIEDMRSLHEVIVNGLDPLVPYYEKWSQANIAKQVDAALLSL